MQNIPIQAIPNQQFNIVIDNNRWEIEVKSTNGTISCSIARNNVPLVTNARAVGGMRILPCVYQEDGNFAIITQNQQVPDYREFGVSQFMIYLSAAELEEIRTPTPTPIPQSFFDPLGALPLRYAPQGYVLAP